jgi:hypothetical protein
MRPTDPRAPISGRESSTLLEDLCVALRDVGVHDRRGLPSDRQKAAIGRVQSLDQELSGRGVAIRERISQLSAETGWLMEQLLDERREYPRTRPRLRDHDGIRRALRCSGCRTRERPESDEHFFICNYCLRMVSGLLEQRASGPHALIFRSYTPEARCEHADESTPVAVYPWHGEHDDIARGFCETCIAEELRRRGQAG